MIKIFAKYGTDEKVLIMCPEGEVHNTRLKLNKEYGGEWLLVDKLHLYSEMLRFNDGLKYLGFDPKQDRYCNFIANIIKP